MNEKLNVETTKTAAESPFSNGMVERHNLVLAETMAKTKEDAKCDDEMALACACCAKNALSNNNGYSANQRVFGRNINLPSVLTDALPALEPTQTSEMVRRNLEAIHSAREHCIKAESSERIRRALRHKLRSYGDHRFENGEKVFYKRKGYKGWKGPATVIGEEGKIVLIRHGSAYYRCHPCHLMKVLKREGQDNESKLSTGSGEIREKDMGGSKTKERSEVDEVESDDDDDVEAEVADGLDESRATEVDSTDGGDSQVDQTNQTRPNRNTRVEYDVGNNSVQAKVLSVQPKRSGTNGNWVNVHVDGDEKPSSVNWDKVLRWKEIEEAGEEVLFLNRDDELSQEIVDAKAKEVVNLIDNSVFEEVKDVGQSCVSCKWVITSKGTGIDKIVKARLVARGFEERMNDARTDSPTCSRQSLRMAFVTASTMKWKIHSMDITSAFLQGNGIERNVYLKPPPEANSKGVVWKLKRVIYGLNDAPRAWYERVRGEFLNLGGKVSLFDEAMFLWHNEECNIVGIIVTHVDDFIYAGTEEWKKEVGNSRSKHPEYSDTHILQFHLNFYHS